MKGIWRKLISLTGKAWQADGQGRMVPINDWVYQEHLKRAQEWEQSAVEKARNRVKFFSGDDPATIGILKAMVEWRDYLCSIPDGHLGRAIADRARATGVIYAAEPGDDLHAYEILLGDFAEEAIAEHERMAMERATAQATGPMRRQGRL